jgi:hypothetical protein
MQPPDLEDRAARQGVLSRRVLAAAGMTDAALRWRLDTAALQRVHRGVFVAVDTPLSFERRAWAAAVAGGGRCVPSHLSSAAALGLWLPPGYRGTPAEATTDGAARARRDSLVTSRARLASAELLTWDGGLVVTDAGRTVADVLRRHGRFAGVIAAESAVRRALITRDAVPPAIAPLIEPASQSPLESAIRLCLHDAGITGLVAQYALWDDVAGCMRYLDLADPERRIAIEADGRSAHDGPDALYQDRFRQNVLMLAGWVVLRFTWADVLRRPGYVVATVRRSLLRTS